ncbi:MAG: thiamine phosphate synthase [Nitrospirae bacterium]|nr:MAG: thiamine phosphate synthase [Nitrospirota bacterium]
MLDRQAAQGRPLADVLTAAAEAGARLFQYRDKTATAAEAYRQALRLRQTAADRGAIFLVNDRCDLALAVEADGVHLGQDDLPLVLARTILGPEKIIGLSTHCEADVTDATAEGADYIGFGPIFPTGSKPDHEPIAGIEGLRRIRSLTHLPVFAIGGLTADRVHAVTQAGADGVAVISAIVGAPDVAAAVRAFMARLP